MKESLKVIKIGGKVAEDEGQLQKFLHDFNEIEGKKILVHGGGVTATQIEKKLGIESQMIEGRRVTSKESLDVITMVYGGLINKKLVAKLQALGSNALGLSGADLNIIQAQKRNVEPIDFGFVGDIEKVNSEALKDLLEKNVIPVLAPLTHNMKGDLLNTNADSIAAFVAASLVEEYNTELVLCFEGEGVMNNGKLVTRMNKLLFRYLEGHEIIKDGMIPKIELGLAAYQKGAKVRITGVSGILNSEAGTIFEN